MEERVTLLARDAETLGLLSACLQDAIVPVVDMAYLPAERQFVLVANRFRWEKLAEAGEGCGKERVLCGVRFDNISAARTRGLDLHDRQRILNLLCVRWQNGDVLLCFSGEATVALTCDPLACVAQDVGEPWPTPCCPQHVLDPI